MRYFNLYRDPLGVATTNIASKHNPPTITAHQKLKNTPSIILTTPKPTEFKNRETPLPPSPVKKGSVPLTPPAIVPFARVPVAVGPPSPRPPVPAAVPVALLPTSPVPVGISTDKSPFVLGNFPTLLVPESVVLVALAIAGFANLIDVVGKGSLLGGLGSGLHSPAIHMSPPQQQELLQHISPASQQKPLHLKELVPQPPEAKTLVDRLVDMIMSVKDVVNFIVNVLGGGRTCLRGCGNGGGGLLYCRSRSLLKSLGIVRTE